MPEPTNWIAVVSNSSVALEKPSVVGVKVMVSGKLDPGCTLTGSDGTPERENGLLFMPIPMFEMTAGSVPVFWTSNMIASDCVIAIGLNTTELFDDPSVMVFPPATYEKASCGPSPVPASDSVSELIKRLPVRFPDWLGEKLIFNVRLALGART